MKRTIKLYGALATETGVDTISLDVDNSAQLFAGLRSLVDGFRKAAAKYPAFKVITTKKEKDSTEIVRTKDVLYPFGDSDEIHLVPQVEGNDPVDTIYAIADALEVSFAAAAVIYVVASVAVVLALNAIAQSMAPKPQTSSAGNDRSFIFSGPTNTANQGGPVPIIYGTCLVGSTIIASNYLSIEVPVGVNANTRVYYGRK